MKTARTSLRQWRLWLAAVIGILGIIGGVRQQAWAGSAAIHQPIKPGAPANQVAPAPASASLAQ